MLKETGVEDRLGFILSAVEGELEFLKLEINNTHIIYSKGDDKIAGARQGQ